MNDTFEIDGLSPSSDTIQWTFQTDYTDATARLDTGLPSCNITSKQALCTGPRARFGNATMRMPRLHQQIGFRFYGTSVFQKNANLLSGILFICTPIVCDSSGVIYFGYRCMAPNPFHLVSGIARIGSTGECSYVEVSQMSKLC